MRGRLQLLAILVVSHLVGVPSFSQAEDARTRGSAAPDLSPLDNVDERLFLVHYLNNTYSAWPVQPDSQWLVDRRLFTIKLYEHIKQSELGSQLIEMYSDCIQLFVEQQHYLEDVGAVEKGAIDMALNERRHQIATTGVAATLDIGSGLAQGATLGEAASASAAGIGIGIGVAVISGIIASAERDAQKKATLARLHTRYLDAIKRTHQRAITNVATLTKRYGWAPGEAGLGPDSSKAVPPTDPREIMRRRPRDPCAFLYYASIVMPPLQAEPLLSDARLCITAARMIPTTDPIYEAFRLDCLRLACYLALAAADQQAIAADFKYPLPCSDEVIGICRARIQHCRKGRAAPWGRHRSIRWDSGLGRSRSKGFRRSSSIGTRSTCSNSSKKR